MEVVAGAEADQAAFFIQELGINVEEKHMLLVVEPGDDLVGLFNLDAVGIGGAAASGEDGQQHDLGVGKSLRSSRTSAPIPSAISGPLAPPALFVPIMSMMALGLWPWPSPFCRPQRMPCVVSPETPKLATFMSPKYLLKTPLTPGLPARSAPRSTGR